MNHEFTFCGAQLQARASKCLWWADQSLLCVSDMHLGKQSRNAKRGGGMLPPYATQDTLVRLADEIAHLQPRTVICLGDSFDDLDAETEMSANDRSTLVQMMAGRRWIWIEGNHDPGPVDLAGTHLAEITLGPITFRHIADPQKYDEISGHYHPKARARGPAAPAFLVDQNRIIMPAFGTYTGGLYCDDPAIADLMAPRAVALLAMKQVIPIPMPRGR